MQQDTANMAQMSRNCLYLYIIFAVAPLLMFSVAAMIFGTVLLLGAVIYVQALQARAKGSWLESHFQWLARTFWIGGGVYLPVITVIATFLVWNAIDQQKLYDAMLSGQIQDQSQIYSYLLNSENMRAAVMISAACGLPFMLWWLYRCWTGFRHWRAQMPLPHPKSWV